MGVFVLVENAEIDGWQSVSITDNMANIADSFSVSTPNTENGAGLYLPISPFDSVNIYDDDDLDLVGWCDDMDTTIQANNNSLTAKGRSLASDLVDCSVEIKGKVLRNVDAFQIMQSIAKPYNIPLSVASGVDLGPKFEVFKPEPGETCFAAINRALKDRSLIASTVPATGGVELVKAKAKRATDDLIVGVNCKLATGKWSGVNRFSEYKVLGQAPPERKKEGTGTVVGSVGTEGGIVSAPKQTTIKNRNPRKTNQAYGVATDTEVPRHRLKIIRPEKRTNSTLAEKRARWEATFRAGESSGINLTTTSWRQSGGAPWRSNMLVMVTVPQYNMKDYEMLIKSVTKVYSVNGGRSLNFRLVHPDTFTPPPQNNIQKGRKKSAWKQGRLIASVGRADAGEIVDKS